jgi:hypothetical protein
MAAVCARNGTRGKGVGGKEKRKVREKRIKPQGYAQKIAGGCAYHVLSTRTLGANHAVNTWEKLETKAW